jgi:hypothetical protein
VKNQEALEVTLGLAKLRMSAILPGRVIKIGLVCEISDGGVYVAFDDEEITDTNLAIVLRKAANCLGEPVEGCGRRGGVCDCYGVPCALERR